MYNLKNILSKKATYNIILGNPAIGKTYTTIKYCLKYFIENGEPFIIIKRKNIEFKERNSTIFNIFVKNGIINDLTNGEYDDVYYHSKKWYLCRRENGKRIILENPFAFELDLSTENNKSLKNIKIGNVVFDEFLSPKPYLHNEFTIFKNIIFPIVKQKNDVKIFMLGNLINKNCPYFHEMGITHIKNMVIGDIDVYKYENMDVAVEMAGD